MDDFWEREKEGGGVNNSCQDKVREQKKRLQLTRHDDGDSSARRSIESGCSALSLHAE